MVKTKETGSVLTLAKRWVERAVVGTEPGQYADYDWKVIVALLEVEEHAQRDKSCTRQLLDGMDQFLSRVHCSNRIINEEKNLLEYSTYRRELTRLVFKARAILLIEAEQYTEGAKIALLDQIERAEAALNGTYTAPFVRNRAFVKPRADEDIQAVTEHCTMAPSYSMGTYGLGPALEWYTYQHIMTDCYQTETVYASSIGCVHESSPELSQGDRPTVELNPGSIAYLSFKLPSVGQRRLRHARLRLVNHHIDGKRADLYAVDHSNRDFMTLEQLTYRQVEQQLEMMPGTDHYLRSFQLGFAEGFSYADLSRYVIRSIEDGEQVQLALSLAEGELPCGFYTCNHPEEQKRPLIELFWDDVQKDAWQQKAIELCQRAKRILEDEQPGSGLGQVKPEAYRQLEQELANMECIARSSLERESISESGRALVRLLNAMRDLRHSRVLRSDFPGAWNLFFTEQGLDDLRAKIEQNAELSREFGKVREWTERRSLSDLQSYVSVMQEQPDWTLLNEQFGLWTRSRLLTFTPPENAVSASLAFVLPSEENKEHGKLGHVWIDRVDILPAHDANLEIENSGFDEGNQLPNHWTPVAIKGEPILRREDQKEYVQEGNHSIYLENPTSEDEGAWAYEKDIPLQGGVNYTLTYFAKVEGKFKQGVQAVLTFKDASGREVGSFRGLHNKKSLPGNPELQLTVSFQADALMYALTGERSYAEKVKLQMLWLLNDYCQGVESWLVHNVRPDGLDAYGAVQIGRVTTLIATSYSLIREANVFSHEEYDRMMAQLDYLIRDLMDLRDRTELGAYRAQQGTSNWQTDMAAGAAMLAMAFPEMPHARQWLDNGRLILKGQLDYHINEDGSWPESIRYLFAVIQRYGTFAKTLRHMTGENWFQGTRFSSTFQYALSVQTPPYVFFDNKISTPNFGDHTLDDGVGFAVLGLYVDEIFSSDPELGAQVYETWTRAGKPLCGFGVESNMLENFFMPSRIDTLASDSKTLNLTSQRFEDIGLYLFRQNFNSPNERYLSVISSQTPVGHGHHDQGSFIWYVNGIPLVVDPGVESYFDSTFAWYKGSSSHSVVQFRHKGQYVDMPRVSEVQHLRTSDLLDEITIRIQSPTGAGSHTRHIAYVKNGLDALILWDVIRDAREGTRMNLPLAATSTVIEDRRALSSGHYGIDVETTSLLPQRVDITHEWGRSCALAPPVEGKSQLSYLRVKAGENEPILTVLYAHPTGSEGLHIKPIPCSEERISAYQIMNMDRVEAILVVNTSDERTIAELNYMYSLMDTRNKEIIPEMQSQIRLSLDGGQLRVFVPFQDTDQI
ncbi:heparinase II/III-family protein [Paenibacillus sp. LS1]|uniref:heparinase II/III-family protein n=1 Tax=Paenibacillus sp. LS1 TaxID=2992120 RepID=UPI00222F8A46|nr:heparinase II/III-family protein [Paenibacillus sp. LS1]MCW3790227.1 heparinase II/III-family protein [Paenibacillus sp. LS1]